MNVDVPLEVNVPSPPVVTVIAAVTFWLSAMVRVLSVAKLMVVASIAPEAATVPAAEPPMVTSFNMLPPLEPRLPVMVAPWSKVTVPLLLVVAVTAPSSVWPLAIRRVPSAAKLIKVAATSAVVITVLAALIVTSLSSLPPPVAPIAPVIVWAPSRVRVPWSAVVAVMAAVMFWLFARVIKPSTS